MTIPTPSPTSPPPDVDTVRAVRSRAAPVAPVAAANGSVVIAGANTSTGRLVAGLAVKAFGGENVTLIVNKDAQSMYWPEEMPTDIVEQRMYAPEAELVKATLTDPRDAGGALAAAEHLLFCAEWGATQMELAEMLLPMTGANLKRAIMLSRVGINRRDKQPFVVGWPAQQYLPCTRATVPSDG